MVHMKKLSWIVLLIAVAGGLVAAFVHWGGDGKDDNDVGQTLVSRRMIAEQRREKMRNRRKAIRERIEGRRQAEAQKTSVSIDEIKEIEQLAEGELTELQRQVLLELDQALLRDDKQTALSKIVRLLAMIRESPGLSAQTRTRLSRHLVSALGWLGGDGVPELISFLADEDPDIRELAMNEFEQALWDFSLGDRAISQIVIAAAQVLTDRQSLEQIMFNIDFKMRHSVGVETMLAISRSGTDQAREVLTDEIVYFTGDDEIKTEEDLVRWLDEHPDSLDDEEFYGPQEDF